MERPAWRRDLTGPPLCPARPGTVRHADVLELAILGLLHEQEMHGYEIRRRLRDELGLFANISFGSLYPRSRGSRRATP